MITGLYEQIINNLIHSKISGMSRESYFIKEEKIDKSEASRILSQYLLEKIHYALSLAQKENNLEKQIELANKIISLLNSEIQKDINFEENLIHTEAKILTAVFSKMDSGIVDFEKKVQEITPYSGISQSELFTGSNAGISLESEIKKEILSSDKINLLVSFIKWSGIRIFEKELTEFINKGGRLKVITTSYMGATDKKAVDFLSSFNNSSVKISYNSKHERLHAKAYLFLRNTGFHTGYIGSSNISRSALTNGLEWNLKITTKEAGHLINKFKKTFETYWEDNEFEDYDQNFQGEKLIRALKSEIKPGFISYSAHFEIQPYPYQQEILENLEVERNVHQRFKNLIVAATGTGKTIISAFDYKKFKSRHKSARLLFIAHRIEILQQARQSFQGILRDNNFGEIWGDKYQPDNYDYLFVTVQTLFNNIHQLPVSKDFYDYIIIDEVHHIAAKSYRPVLEKFTPKILFGLTATPERMDGEDILKDFSDRIAAEIRLPEALNRKLLCPFQYFGIADNVDISKVSWKNGRYNVEELTNVYTANNQRSRDIIINLYKYLNDVHEVRALCFCVSQQHASFMCKKFNEAGLKADILTSKTSANRISVKDQLIKKEINYLFVVDIFNEGIDIPEIDTVIFLRPTESLTVFLQQLGRGLRMSDGKDCLTVLDFVGNGRPEYDFEGKFRALIGKTNSSVTTEVEKEFPHLPLGCTIILEKKVKEIILNNIQRATSFRKENIINRIKNYEYQTGMPLTLVNFCKFNNFSPENIYKRYGWMSLLSEAGKIQHYTNFNEKQILSAIKNKWIATSSTKYFNFILKLARNNFNITKDTLSGEDLIMCLMLHYDVWQKEKGFTSMEASINAIGKNKFLIKEIIEYLEYRLDNINHNEYKLDFPFYQPLMVHGRYTRDQILTAFEFNKFEKKSYIREGVALSKTKNIEILFVTLNKSEKDYSPGTLYDDFAISENLFHWQSQNIVSPESLRGQSYINHLINNKKILLFVRESNEDENGNTRGFVFLGECKFNGYYGSRPMSITWELSHSIPPFLWKDTAKMAVG